MPILVMLAAAALLAGGDAPAAPIVRISTVDFAGAWADPAGEVVPLRLVGAGLVRWGWFVRLYAAAYYVDAQAESADPNADVSRRLEVACFGGLTGRRLGDEVEELLASSARPDELAPLRERLDRIREAFRDVRPGDRYALTYVPGRGTLLSLNGERLVEVEGADLAHVYFGIWLGEHSTDPGLRRALLAGAGDHRAPGRVAAVSARR